MAFNPDEYLKQKKAAGSAPSKSFDPDAYLKSKKAQTPPISGDDAAFAGSVFREDDNFSVNAPTALLSALGDSITLGADKLGVAALSAGKDVLTGEVPLDQAVQRYREYRDDLTNKRALLEEAYPKLTLAGQLGGSVVPALFLSGEAALAKGASGLAKIVEAMKTGTKAGSIMGFTHSDGDLTKSFQDPNQAIEVAKDTIEGAGIGAGGGLVTQSLLNMVNPKYLEKVARHRAAKASGIDKKTYKHLYKTPRKDVAGNIIEGETGIDEYGQRLLDNKISTPFASPEDMYIRSQELQEKAGSKIGEIIKKLDSEGSVTTAPDPSKVIPEIEKQIGKPLLNPQGQPYQTTASHHNVLQNIVDDIATHGNTPTTFEEAQALKLMLKEAAFGPDGVTIADKQAHRAYGIVNKWIEDAAEATASQSTTPNLLAEYRNAKKDYQTGALSEKSALGKIAADGVNRDFSLTDYIAGGAGAVAKGDPLTGATAAVTNKVMRTYGNNIAAGTARGASKLFSLPKQGIQKVAQSLMSKGETGQKLGNLLLQAAERDDVGKNAILFTIMQQTAYKDLLNEHLGDPNVR